MPDESTTTATTKRRRLFDRRPSEAGRGFAMIQPHRAQAKSPALRKVAEVETNREGRKSTDLGWQREAYSMLVDVGEAGFAMDLTANTLSRCDFPVKRHTADGDVDADDPRVMRVMAALVPPRGGFRELKRRLALHAVTGGEWYLVGTPGVEGTVQLGILWEALSVLELEIDTTGKVRRTTDAGPKAEVGGDVYVARGWVSDPAYSNLATSQMKRALIACREVRLHDEVIEASGQSRLAAGILFIPDEMSFGPARDTPAEEVDEDEEIDELTEQLIVQLSTPVVDRTSAARLTPLILRGKAEDGKSVRYIELGRQLDVTSVELREKALHRLIRQLDMPPEIVEGKANLSGLGGGNVADTIDEDFVAKHIAPLGETIADFLTVAYLRVMLETFEGMPPEESITYFVDFDPSPLEGDVDREGSARGLHVLDLLSDKKMVEAAGFDPTDMPDAAELTSRKAYALIMRSPQLAPLLLTKVKGFEDVDPAALEALLQADPAPSIPDQGGDRPGGFAQLVDRVTVAADSALDRALEKAGARLVTRAERHPAMRDRLRTIDKRDAFTALGAADLVELGLDAASLLDGAWDHLDGKVRGWLRQYLEQEQFMPGPAADTTAALAVTVLCERLADHVLLHLHSGLSVGPNQLRLPHELVEEAFGQVLGATV